MSASLSEPLADTRSGIITPMRRRLAPLLALSLLPIACADDGSSLDDASANETGDEQETGDGDGDLDPGLLSTCGSGGAFGDWTRYDVELSWYDVLAPAPNDEPLPLVIALHGDEGNPGAVQWHWGQFWMGQPSFIVATPQLHHQVGGSTSENGWDNHPDDGVALILQVLADLEGRYDIDINRTYITGVSAGSWFLGQRGFSMQDLFAATQLSCGASPVAWGLYDLPNDACKLPTRLETSADDFLFGQAETLRDELLALGHEVEFSATACNGHCCGGPQEYAAIAWAFFEQHTRCGGLVVGEPGGSCGSFGTLP
jgi:predicted esterase